MEINTIRVVVEVLAFVAFLAIVAWAWSKDRKAEFDAASRLPFRDEP